jgi:hypothetical protein
MAGTLKPPQFVIKLLAMPTVAIVQLGLPSSLSIGPRDAGHSPGILFFVARAGTSIFC